VDAQLRIHRGRIDDRLARRQLFGQPGETGAHRLGSLAIT
jgi:hypothetical protein